MGKQKNGRNGKYSADSLRLFLTTPRRYIHWLGGRQLLAPDLSADAIEKALDDVVGKKKRALRRNIASPTTAWGRS